MRRCRSQTACLGALVLGLALHASGFMNDPG